MLLALPAMASADEYIVKFKSSSTGNQIDRLEGLGLQVTDHHDAGNLIQVFIEEKDAAKKIAELYRDSDVQYVVKSFKLHTVGHIAKVKTLREQWAP